LLAFVLHYNRVAGIDITTYEARVAA